MGFNRTAAVLVVFGLTGCRDEVLKPCGLRECRVDQICSTKYRACIPDEPPTVEILQPAADALVSSAKLVLRGIATDDLKVEQLEWATEDGQWNRAPFNEEGAFEIDVPVPERDFSNFTVRVQAFDRLSRAGKQSVSLHIDRRPPDCAITSPAQGARFAESDGPRVAITGRAVDAALSTAELSFDDGATWIPLAVEAGHFTSQLEAPIQADGVSRRVRLRASDTAGNTCDAPPVELWFDTTPPTVTLESPTSGTLVGQTAAVEVSLHVQDAALMTVSAKVGEATDTRADGVGTGSLRLNVPLPEGVDYLTRELKVTVRDQAGNERVTTRQLLVDRVPPALTITSPADNAIFNVARLAGATTVPVTWRMTDGDTRARVEREVTPAPTFDSVTGTSLTVTTSPTDNGKSYRVALRAVDSVGHVSLSQVSFTVDRVAPKFSVEPAWDARDVEKLTVRFSEPVAQQNPSFVSFSRGGSRGPSTIVSPTEWEIADLDGDTIYEGTVVPQARDMADNGITQGNVAVRFLTTPKSLRDGAFLATNVRRFHAVSDNEGVVFTAIWHTGVQHPLNLGQDHTRRMPRLPAWMADSETKTNARWDRSQSLAQTMQSRIRMNPTAALREVSVREPAPELGVSVKPWFWLGH